MGSPGGPTQKKTLWGARAGPPKKKNKKIFLVVVAHFLRVQTQPIYCGHSRTYYE